jgi:hypothetical protein
MATFDFLGITVLGDFILSEGVEGIIDNLTHIGATAVTVNPTVTGPADEKTGSFQPPIDAGSSPRVFDRELFGKHALWVRGGVSYRPRQELYAESAYEPRKPNDLTEQHGAIIGEFIDRAVEVGLKVYLQLGAVQPSGLRDKDKPRLPNGELPENRMANTGSLASEAVRSYNRAYIRDLLTEYPNITGFRPDWPEYPCYTFGEVFQDFSDHVADWAHRNGFDFETIKNDVGMLYDLLLGNSENQRLTNADFESLGEMSSWSQSIREWLRLKSALSNDTLQHWRDAITAGGGENGGQYELSTNAFMTPYSTATGLDFAGAARICNAVSPKFYTMHWSLMVQFWAEPILAANPQLSEESVVGCLVKLMDIDDDFTGKRVSDYGYPNPDEPHPIPDGPQLRKLDQVVAEMSGPGLGDVFPLVHGYGPVDDFARRLALVGEHESINGLWINRYGYLSDEKLEVIRRIKAVESVSTRSLGHRTK